MCLCVCACVCMCVYVCVCVYVCMYVRTVRSNVTPIAKHYSHVSRQLYTSDMPHSHRATEAVVNRNILFTPRNELIMKFHQTERVHKILHIPRIFCEGKYCPFLFKLTSNVKMRGVSRIHNLSAGLWQLWCRASYVQTARCAKVKHGFLKTIPPTLFRAEVNALNLALNWFRREMAFDCEEASCKEMWPVRNKGRGEAGTVCCGNGTV
jgi:hypothetical protein